MARPSVYGPEIADAVLRALRSGKSRKDAAKEAGFDDRTLRRHARRHPDFATAMEQAEAEHRRSCQRELRVKFNLCAAA